MSRFSIVPVVFASVFAVAAAPAWSANEPAARIEKLTGVVEAVAADQPPRRLSAGANVATGERIQVGPGSSATLRFKDDSVFDIGANGVLVVDRFEMSKQAEESTFATRILKGTFRFVTGLIAKQRPGSMQVGLPVATIGIRGTHVVGEADTTSARVILLEPEDNPKRATSVEVANQFGSVVIDKPGYGTEIPDAHSPPSPVRRMQVRQVEDMLRAIRSSAMHAIPPRPR